MKKVLLAIAAVATITSCSQNEEFENLGQKEEINFTPVVGKATRVTPLVTDAFE
ncbi:fimbrillin family protein, partial [Bacteroides thetaiotaomicron]